MILDYFDKVLVISLKKHETRKRRIKEQLESRSSKFEFFEAVPGSELGCPNWWKNGNGAWGCLLSHQRILEYIWLNEWNSTLILEDDAIFGDKSDLILEDFFEKISSDWEQMYLGGYHSLAPENEGGYYRGISINRTHAYAVKRRAIPRIHRHISHAPDYINAGSHDHHVDHQLEIAHQREDWNVYCPLIWPMGQGENDSEIDGRTHSDRFWDYDGGDVLFSLPYVIVEEDEEIYQPLHFGYKLEKGSDRIDEAVRKAIWNPGILRKVLRTIARQAHWKRMQPAIVPLSERQREQIVKIWPEVQTQETMKHEFVKIP